MLFFQDEKDKLRDTLADLQRQINNLQTDISYGLNQVNNRLDSLTHPHGARKDGTPRAKPGRKPRGVKA